LATIGLPLLDNSIREFRNRNRDHSLDICGIVFNHSSTYTKGPEAKKAIQEVMSEAEERGWKVYATQLRYSATYPKAAREGAPLGRTSHVRQQVPYEFQRFVDEFLTSIKLTRKAK